MGERMQAQAGHRAAQAQQAPEHARKPQGNLTHYVQAAEPGTWRVCRMGVALQTCMHATHLR
jgi:hypothetical protein